MSSISAHSFNHSEGSANSSEEGTLTWMLGHDSDAQMPPSSPPHVFEDDCSPSPPQFIGPAAHYLDGVLPQYACPRQPQPQLAAEGQSDPLVQQVLDNYPPALLRIMKSAYDLKAEIDDLAAAQRTTSTRAPSSSDRSPAPRPANFSGVYSDDEPSQSSSSVPTPRTPIARRIRPLRCTPLSHTASTLSSIVPRDQDNDSDDNFEDTESCNWVYWGLPDLCQVRRRTRAEIKRYSFWHDTHLLDTSPFRDMNFRNATPESECALAATRHMAFRNRQASDAPLRLYSWWDPTIPENGRQVNQYGKTIWLDNGPLPIAFRLSKAFGRRRAEEEALQRRLAHQRAVAAAYQAKIKQQRSDIERCMTPQPELGTAHQAHIAQWAQQSRNLAPVSRQSTPTDCSDNSTGYANSASTAQTIPLSQASSGCSDNSTGYANSASTAQTIPLSQVSSGCPKPRRVIRIRSRSGSSPSCTASAHTSTNSLCVPDRDVASFDPDVAFLEASDEHIEVIANGTSSTMVTEEEKKKKDLPPQGFFMRCWKTVKGFVKKCLYGLADRL